MYSICDGRKIQVQNIAHEVRTGDISYDALLLK
jgi:hypothetical protein